MSLKTLSMLFFKTKILKNLYKQPTQKVDEKEITRTFFSTSKVINQMIYK